MRSALPLTGSGATPNHARAVRATPGAPTKVVLPHLEGFTL